MGWTSASTDLYYTKGERLHCKVPSLNAAIDYCEMMGYGWDVMYPKFRYHTKKNYADSFVYKGEPKPVADYD